MANKKILLVEDDPNFGTVLKDYLALNDYEVTHAKDGLDGLISFKNDDFDICILDVMMPKKDGFSLAKDIRSVNNDIPLIFLTAKSMKEDILKGYQVGADDYLNKPFDSEVLLYKIKAILSRKETDTSNEDNQFEFKIGNFDLNSKLRQLSFKGEEPRKLSPKENKLLKLLALYKNDLLPRELALTKIWRDDIINIHGEGFRLLAE
jgi:DNA-binding response OmpR family regulator